MAERSDYRELLQLLNDYQVKYLIVGGYAMMKYAEPRASGFPFARPSDRQQTRLWPYYRSRTPEAHFKTDRQEEVSYPQHLSSPSPVQRRQWVSLNL